MASVTYLSRLGLTTMHRSHTVNWHTGSAASLSLNKVLYRSLCNVHSIVNIACVRGFLINLSFTNQFNEI